MYGLRDAMSPSPPRRQPDRPGRQLDQAGSQLQLLSQDLATIGTSLDTTEPTWWPQRPIWVSSRHPSKAHATVDRARVEIRPRHRHVPVALIAVAGWVVLFAIGCVLVGLYLVFVGRREGRDLVA